MPLLSARNVPRFSPVAYGRLLGMTLVMLVIACWPRADAVPRAALHAVLAYNLPAALYLARVGVARHPAGIPLWPAVAEHALVTRFLAARLRAARPATATTCISRGSPSPAPAAG